VMERRSPEGQDSETRKLDVMNGMKETETGKIRNIQELMEQMFSLFVFMEIRCLCGLELFLLDFARYPLGHLFGSSVNVDRVGKAFLSTCMI
jgi:hypothetical protein